jgi:hypothetical protein
MRTIALLAALLIAIPTAAQSPLDQVSWLAGCWSAGRGTRETLEMWMPPSGGTMLGAGRTVISGRTREYEHLRITADGDTLVYTALPSRQAETAFRSVAVSADGFTVENLQHDFPQRIVYRRAGADSLAVRVEGPGPNGPRGFDLAFRRVSCEAGR